MLPEYPLKILVVGSGGREHALAWKIAKNKSVEKIFCAPGNGGTAGEAKCENVPIGVMDFAGLEKFALENKVDLVVVGPDNPLADGIVDALEKANLRVFGPTREQAKLEWSKAHAKKFMDRLGLPTPRYLICNSHEEAKKAATENPWAQVVKVDGLALGKGVFVCDNESEVLDALQEIFGKRSFGTAGETVLLEEKIVGEELSLLMLCDGKTLIELAPCQDHKRRFDGDSGPNTGGMGAYSPVELYERHKSQIKTKIVEPLQKALSSGALSFKGVLYAGIIVSESGPEVLEFNARFGDPETQALMPRLKSDLLEALWACTCEGLNNIKMEWIAQSSCCVVAVGEKYPAASSKGETITTAPHPGTVIYQAGTKFVDGHVITDGGRVLAVVATAPTMEAAAKTCYAALEKVSFNGMDYRKDIARRAFKQCLSS
ncbi:MAG: phosphoribosylamine--glycine ligase [Candidatus Melainabacteria bacterium]|nr:MAG: phosphoribosylamine--glycine ligase [Candidatus Melainabacteria bacterium]